MRRFGEEESERFKKLIPKETLLSGLSCIRWDQNDFQPEKYFHLAMKAGKTGTNFIRRPRSA